MATALPGTSGSRLIFMELTTTREHGTPPRSFFRSGSSACCRLVCRRIDYDIPPQDLELDSARLPAVPRSRFAMSDVRARV
jgi:hypothetical protein